MLLVMNRQNSSCEPTAKHASPEEDRALDVVLACEDFAAGMHALGTFDKLFPVGDSGRLPDAQSAWKSVWKFELLEITCLRDDAAAESAGAQMVIISAHAPGELPSAVKRWFETWIKNRTIDGGALVLLLDDAGADVHRQFPVEAYLEKHAAGAGMKYATHKAAGRHAFYDLNLAMASQKIPDALKGLRETMFMERRTHEDTI
jgi:hypothetical protein